jgi:hypothetical protein
VFRRWLVFFVGAAGHNHQRLIPQRPLQRLRIIPWRAHPDITLFIGRQDHIALGWIGSTIAFGDVVREL